MDSYEKNEQAKAKNEKKRKAKGVALLEVTSAEKKLREAAKGLREAGLHNYAHHVETIMESSLWKAINQALKQDAIG